MSNGGFVKVYPAVWRSKRVKALSCDGKVVHLYILTSSHHNSAGCFRLPDAYGAADLDWPLDRYSAARDEVQKARLIFFDPETEEIFVDRWFGHCPATNPKHAIGIKNLISRIESDSIREMAEAAFEETQSVHSKSTNGSLNGKPSEGFANGIQ